LLLDLTGFIDVYSKTISECDSGLTTKQEMKSQISENESKLNAEYKHAPYLFKVLLFPINYFRKLSAKARINAIDRSITQLEQIKALSLTNLIVTSARELMLNDPGISSELKNLEDRHHLLHQAKLSVEKVYFSGKNALSAIETAISSISNSEMVEVVDLFSSSKLISVASSISNSSSSDAVNQAKSAVQDFNNQLDKHQRIVNELPDILTIELLDLGLDLTLGGVFDMVGSALSLSALSSANSTLEETKTKILDALKQVEPAYRHSRDTLSEHEEKLLEFKNKERLKVIPLLMKHGIIVDEGTVLSITDLYAPSKQHSN